ncbi:hypothetical protein [Botrimarina sp.]|uniref:hypothetical protein n=1 Tax=Botrimarina sp. TaxID=2795802 RepID=UPI0032F0759C
MSKRHLRKRLYVDRKVQGALIARAARYWAVSVTVVAMLTVIGWVFLAPGVGALVRSPELLRGVLTCLVISVVVSGLLLPIVLYDLVRFTHRFAGPMVRLRESMRRVAAGETVETLRFRDGDYWQEFADAFNAMQARIENAPIGSAPPTRGADERGQEI